MSWSVALNTPYAESLIFHRKVNDIWRFDFVCSLTCHDFMSAACYESLNCFINSHHAEVFSLLALPVTQPAAVVL